MTCGPVLLLRNGQTTQQEKEDVKPSVFLPLFVLIHKEQSALAKYVW